MKTTLFVLCLLFVQGILHAQFKELTLPETGRTYTSITSCSFDNLRQEYIMTLNTSKGMVRLLMDTGFKEKSSYASSIDYDKYGRRPKLELSNATFYQPPVHTGFISNNQGYFDCITNGAVADIFMLDFTSKKDSLIKTIHFPSGEENAALLCRPDAIIFFNYRKKSNEVVVRKWFFENRHQQEQTFVLPKSSITKEEQKEKGSFLKIKYDDVFLDLAFEPVNNPDSYITSSNQVYYINDSLFIVTARIPYACGTHVLYFSENSNTVTFKNLLFNKAEPDNVNTPKQKFILPFLINNNLVIQNSSEMMMEYLFYDVFTGELITKYYAEANKDLEKLVHSELNQQGTYFSAKDEKGLDNQRAFLRKYHKGYKFVCPIISGDSLLITFGSFKETEGIEGTLLSAVTFGLGYMANLHVGDYQVIPYLTSYRYKFTYAHSVFALRSFTPSASTGVTTYLDEILKDVKTKEIRGGKNFDNAAVRNGNTIHFITVNTKAAKGRIFSYPAMKK